MSITIFINNKMVSGMYFEKKKKCLSFNKIFGIKKEINFYISILTTQQKIKI